MRGISSLFLGLLAATGLRSQADNDSKPRSRRNATTTRRANVRGKIPRRLAAGDLLPRSGDPCTRSALRKILAEAVGGGAADHRTALGRRPGVVRRRALFIVQ